MTSKSPSSNDLLLKQEKEKDSSDLNDKNQEVTVFGTKKDHWGYSRTAGFIL